MTFLPPPRPSAGVPALRVFCPEDADSPAANGPGRVDPRWTLSEFFEGWFCPVVLVGDRDDGPNTIRQYREALHVWEILSQGRPIGLIDDVTVAQVQAGLRQGQYRRGLAGRPRTWAPDTVRKHQRSLRSILRRLGPTIDPDHPGVGVLSIWPSLKVDPAPRRRRPKPGFTLDEARTLWAACGTVVPTWQARRGRPRRTDGCPLDGADPSSPEWWRAWIGLAFYTGLRTKRTLLALRRRHLVRDGDRWLVDVPAELVPKTDKPLVRRLHRQAVKALESLRPATPLAQWPPDALLTPWPYDYTHFAARHADLQAAVGLPIRSPQAWRRTHGLAMAVVDVRLERAAWALDHASPTTTAASYVDEERLRWDAIDALPGLGE